MTASRRRLGGSETVIGLALQADPEARSDLSQTMILSLPPRPSPPPMSCESSSFKNVSMRMLQLLSSPLRRLISPSGPTGPRESL